MKKQILFLFAASALFAACSSDDMPVTNGGGEDNGQTVVDENLPSSVSVATAEGLGMSVGALDNAADTRAESDGEVYFDITIYGDDVLAKYDDYAMRADDFAIRINGDYLHVTPVETEEEHGVTKQSFKLVRTDKLKLRVSGLETMTYNPAYEDVYSFECFIWVENKTNKVVEGKPIDEYEELFTLGDKYAWIGGENNKAESGFDVTLKSVAKLHDSSNGEEEDQPEYGYKVTYNVYRGISGRAVDEDGNFDPNGLGDSPYIKVSVNVIRTADDVPTNVAASVPKE